MVNIPGMGITGSLAAGNNSKFLSARVRPVRSCCRRPLVDQRRPDRSEIGQRRHASRIHRARKTPPKPPKKNGKAARMGSGIRDGWGWPSEREWESGRARQRQTEADSYGTDRLRCCRLLNANVPVVLLLLSYRSTI